LLLVAKVIARNHVDLMVKPVFSPRGHPVRIQSCHAEFIPQPEISCGQRKSESAIAALVEMFKIVGDWLILKALGSAKRNHARANRGEI
jgi:hypothetical protein